MNKEEKYKKAINELAESYELHLKQWAKRCIDTINEYTTNLQEENERYKNIIDEIKKLCDENTNGIDDDGYDDAYYDRVYVREIDEIIEKGLKGE